MDDELADLVMQNQTLLRQLNLGIGRTSVHGSRPGSELGTIPSGNALERGVEAGPATRMSGQDYEHLLSEDRSFYKPPRSYAMDPTQRVTVSEISKTGSSTGNLDDPSSVGARALRVSNQNRPLPRIPRRPDPEVIVNRDSVTSSHNKYVPFFSLHLLASAEYLKVLLRYVEPARMDSGHSDARRRANQSC